MSVFGDLFREQRESGINYRLRMFETEYENVRMLNIHSDALVELIEPALKQGKTIVVHRILDKLNVPSDLSLKERIVFFQLFHPGT